jgi:hypothetical protein
MYDKRPEQKFDDLLIFAPKKKKVGDKLMSHCDALN